MFSKNNKDEFDLDTLSYDELVQIVKEFLN